MHQYTTGEMAKLCNVSVRTVQYYDNRGILTPSALSEGGRRLYNDRELERLRTICVLRDGGLPINSIGELLREQDPAGLISDMLDQQEYALKQQIETCEAQHRVLTEVRRSLKNREEFSLDAIGDLGIILRNRNGLRRVRRTMLLSAIPMGIMEWSSLFLWIFQGIWWPFLLYTVLVIPYVAWIVEFFITHISYICPRCHRVFSPGRKELLFAPHTATTRRLRCPCCGEKSVCMETCRE